MSEKFRLYFTGDVKFSGRVRRGIFLLKSALNKRSWPSYCLLVTLPQLITTFITEHLTQIDVRKEKRKRKLNWASKRFSKQYNDIDWNPLYDGDKFPTLNVDELGLFLSHHNIFFKRKKRLYFVIILRHIGNTVDRLAIEESTAEDPSLDISDSRSNPEGDIFMWKLYWVFNRFQWLRRCNQIDPQIATEIRL